MERRERLNIIKKIEKERGSQLIIYITGDRRNLETKIAFDVFPLFHKHLSQIQNQKRIDLLLYSTGGLTIAGYAIVNLIREFSDDFNVIIPFKAYSCATLIALGANEIIMTNMGQLTPIDPSVDHPLAPIVQIPGQAPRISPVSVEDINAFFDLAKNEAGLKKEASMVKIFEILSSKVNPLVLGAVQRSRAQISFLAKSLMKYHTSNKELINKTVDVLTRKRFSHHYIISRREAKEILGLKISEPKNNLSKLIIDLFNAYNDILMMDKAYNPEVVLGTKDEEKSKFNRAIIESIDLTHVFRTVKNIRRVEVKRPEIPFSEIGYQERILQEEWIEDNNL